MMLTVRDPSLISTETLLALRCLARVQGRDLFFLELEVEDLCIRVLAVLLQALLWPMVLVVLLYTMVPTMPDIGGLMGGHFMSQNRLNLDQ